MNSMVTIGASGARLSFRTVAPDMTGDTPLAWQDDALCAQVDSEAFFPDRGGSTRDAKRVCAACDVAAQCLAYALANDERAGIWGGLSPVQRRRMQKAAAA